MRNIFLWECKSVADSTCRYLHESSSIGKLLRVTISSVDSSPDSILGGMDTVRCNLRGDNRINCVDDADLTSGLTGSESAWGFLRPSSFFLEASITKGEGCRGLGIRCSPNEVIDDSRLGDDSPPLKLKNYFVTRNTTVYIIQRPFADEIVSA